MEAQREKAVHFKQRLFIHFGCVLVYSAVLGALMNRACWVQPPRFPTLYC